MTHVKKWHVRVTDQTLKHASCMPYPPSLLSLNTQEPPGTLSSLLRKSLSASDLRELWGLRRGANGHLLPYTGASWEQLACMELFSSRASFV